MLHESKNNPRCEACVQVKVYAGRIEGGGNTQSLDIGMTDMADKTTRVQRKRWNAREIDFLKENYMTIDDKQLAVELDRTPKAVNLKLNKLRLSRVKSNPLGSVRKHSPSRPLAEKKTRRCATDSGTVLVPESIGSNGAILTAKDFKSAHKDFIIVDFTNYPELFEKLQLLARSNHRPPEYQIFHLIDKAR